jgi:chemotaxis family two-component system response regulator Rcp1
MRTIRLLVVQDSPSFQFLIRDAFRPRGDIHWELVMANDGEEAIRVLFEEENENVPLPNLILLDWNLPKIDGGEVLRRIKQHPRLLRIPVLVFSSSEADEDINAAYDNHANGFITKPRTGEALADVVDTIERFWIAIAQLPKVTPRHVQ